MPATGFRIVGTGAFLPWYSISSSFQNSLKTSGHRGYEFLEFWCWNLDIAFQLLKSLWSSLTYIWLWRHLWRSHAVVIAAICGFALSCWNTQGFPWNRRPLEGSVCCSKAFLYLSAFIVPSKTCKLPIPYALMHPHTISDAGFWAECWWHSGRSPSSLARRTQRLLFLTRMSNLDSSDHRTVWSSPF